LRTSARTSAIGTRDPIYDTCANEVLGSVKTRFWVSGRKCGSNPGSPAASPRGQNGLPENWQGTSSPNSLIACRGCRGTGRVSAKLNLLEKTTFYNLRVSEFTSALSLVRGETGTTFRRLRIEETEAMNCTNRLPHWDEQQPKHLRDIRRAWGED